MSNIKIFKLKSEIANWHGSVIKLGMKSFYVLLLVLLSLAEILFTALYFYLTQKLDAVPLTGAFAYAGAIYCLHCSYNREKYESQKREFLENLISS